MRLFGRLCLSCRTRVGPRTALCESCVSRLPTVPMWAYRTAHAERLREPVCYRAALKEAVKWLAENAAGRHRATTQTTAKETSS